MFIMCLLNYRVRLVSQKAVDSNSPRRYIICDSRDIQPSINQSIVLACMSLPCSFLNSSLPWPMPHRRELYSGFVLHYSDLPTLISSTSFPAPSFMSSRIAGQFFSVTMVYSGHSFRSRFADDQWILNSWICCHRKHRPC